MKARWYMIFVVLISVMPIKASFIDELPDTSTILPDYNRETVESKLSKMPLDAIEGIWQFTDDGALVVIERFVVENEPMTEAHYYRMVILKSPRLSVRPGTVMGYISLSAKDKYYNARIYTSFDGGRVLNKSKRFILKLTKDARLSFEENKSGIKLNLWRMVPYMFRYSVSIQQERQDMNGCIKIFPASTQAPITPRYL